MDFDVREVSSQTLQVMIELVIKSKNVLICKRSFAELMNYMERIVPLLKELNKKNIIFSEGFREPLEILNREVKVANELVTECCKRNKVYLLVKCRSISKRLENSAKEFGRALSLIPLATMDISSVIIEDINQLSDSMGKAEFRMAIEEEEILEKIQLGIQERNIDRSYANQLLVCIAEALGISTEKSTLKKEFEEFKNETESAQLRKDQAEAIQMDQIIALLERSDAASSPSQREMKYFSKRKSLGNQPLEPLQSFYCPITKEVMVDPVETSSGHTFERSAIEKWLTEGNKMCPLTQQALDASGLRPNKTLRQSIEEWKDRNTMITIASMQPKLSSSSEEEVLDSLQQLNDLCEQKDIHREWVVLENYIPILVELLGKKNREIRKRTLVILCILAKDRDDAKERIAKSENGFKYIVRCLGRRIGEGKLAVALLLELSKNEFVRDSIGKVQGCILLSVTMLNNSEDRQASRDAEELLENLSLSEQNVIQMAKANYFKYLLQGLSSGPEAAQMSMARSLSEMELTDNNKSSLFEDGVLDPLLHLMSHGDIEIKKVAAKALQNLSSLPKNGKQMIRQGAVRPLLHILFSNTFVQSLCEHVAATVMHLAVSTASQDGSETPVSMFESEEDIYQLFGLIRLACPSVQESILRAFHALCRSQSAAYIKANLAQQQCSALQVLVHLCALDDLQVRPNAVKLLFCLINDSEQVTILDHVDQKSVETFLKIIETNNDEEEIACAMGILSKLPVSPQITDWLSKAEALPLISSFLLNNGQNHSHNNQVTENAAGAVCHLILPTNHQLQKKAAEAGLVSVLVQLLQSGTSVTKQRAAICLSQFSKSSLALTRPIARRPAFCCFKAPEEAICPVHRGICTVESSFCLVVAGAVEPLVRVLSEQDDGAREASLDALLTLIEDERLQSGCKVLAEANAIPSMIRLLGTNSPVLQEKVLNSLERIFRLPELKQKYGGSAQTPLVDLTQRGNSNIRSLAARMLAQLNVLHEQSSYF